MVQMAPVEEVHGQLRQTVHGGIGGEAQHGDHQRRKAQGDCRGKGDPAAHPVKLRLAGGMALHKNRRKELGHIGQGQAAGEQEDPFHQLQNAAVMGHPLHNGLVEQGLADVAVQQRNASDAQGPQQEADHQKGLFPAEAPDLVQIQLVKVPEHSAGAEEEHQLEAGVVHHVQHGAPGRQGVFLPQQAHHAHAHQNKADLGHGGAGQGPLQVNGKQGQHRPQQHGDCAQRQDHSAPGRVPPEEVAGDHQDAPNAGLGQRAGQQRRGRSRGHRMGLGQPDMDREHAGLGPEAEEDTAAGCIQHRSKPLGPGRGIEGVDGQGAEAAPQQKQSHQRHKAADHRHGQIGLGGPDGPGGLLLDDPGEGGEGHDLKEDEGREQVRRQEHAHGGPQGQQLEEIIPVAPVMMGKIVR